MKLFFEKKVVIGFTIALAALAWLIFLSVQNNRQFRNSEQELLRHNEVLFYAEQVKSISTDIETGQRGYTITGDSTFLPPYLKAVQEIGKNVSDLEALVGHGDPRITQLRSLIQAKNEFTVQTVEARHKDFAEARELVISLRGKELMDSIRLIVDLIQADARDTIKQLHSRREVGMAKFNSTFIVITASAVGLLVLVFVAINYSLGAQLRSDLLLKKASLEIKDLYDKAPCGYHSLDEQGYFTDINQTECEWLGYTRAEIVGKLRFADLLTPGSLERFRSSFPEFKARGAIQDLEFDLVTRQGSIIPVVVSATAIKDDKGRFVKSRSTVFDNSERKKLLAEIRAHSDQVLDLYNNAACGYLSLSPEGRIININNTLLQWLGYEREEVVDKLTRADIFPAEALAELEHATRASTRQISINSVDTEMTARNGDSVHVIVSARAIRDEDGSITGTAISVIDNTDRKLAEERNRQLNAELEAFSYSVSHDLRGPLRIVNGYAQILEEDYGKKLDEEAQKVIKVITNNASRMGKLIDDLLDFSRMGRKEVTLARFSFDDMVRRIVEELKEDKKNIHAEIAPLYPVKADVAMMEIVWTNLISNAIKYTSTRAVPKIEVGSYRNNGHTCFFIRDNGVGFNMAYSHKLFNVFQRLHRIDEFPGTGVGLALVKRIVTRHGGTIWAESTPNEGATFHFSLPSD